MHTIILICSNVILEVDVIVVELLRGGVPLYFSDQQINTKNVLIFQVNSRWFIFSLGSDLTGVRLNSVSTQVTRC